MRELSTGKTLTTKEVAQALGVSVRAIQENGKALFPNKIVNGKPTKWTESEAGMIVERIKNNHSTTQATSQVTREVTTAYTVPNLLAKAGQAATTIEQKMQIAQAGMEALAQAMALLKAENNSLKVSLDESKEWASVKLMERLNPNRTFDWRILKRFSTENGIEIKKATDQNYGEVNSYHKSVWESCYELDEMPWE